MLQKTLARVSCALAVLTSLVSGPFGHAEEASGQRRALVKVAAVQISGYDKGDLPRQGYDPAAAIVPYIDRAGKDGAQLVVFPEYVLGHIPVPGPSTEKISAAAATNHIYVIVGGWEDYGDGTYSDTALIFDRAGNIAGKYLKTQAAVTIMKAIRHGQSRPSAKTRNGFSRTIPNGS
jgi:apolipoprotein N-acyltransferase